MGAEIRRVRRAQHITIQEVADAIGISRSHLGMLERGERAPSRVVAEGVIAALGLRGNTADALWNASVDDAGRSRPDVAP